MKNMDTVQRRNLKKRIFEIIQIGNRTDIPSMVFDISIVCIIVLNIAVVFLQTFDELAVLMKAFAVIEAVTVVVFLVEYVLRVWTAQYLYPQEGALKAKLKFMGSFYGIIDLLSFAPYFMPFFFPSGAIAFRMLRVVRILRLFQINSQYDAFNVITDVLKDKKDQLVSSTFMVTVLMMASSLCMYGLEHEAQPENFSNAFSGIWWSVSTLLTVGYGDIYPVTVGGKIMAIVIAFLGVGMVAIPTGIISAGFVEYYTRVKVGTYSQHDADFISLDITESHPFNGKRINDIEIPVGMYVAVVLREGDICTVSDELILKSGDALLLATTSTEKIHTQLQELVLEEGNSFIGCRIKELDISRLSFIVMVKRDGRNIMPAANLELRKKDVLMILNKGR